MSKSWKRKKSWGDDDYQDHDSRDRKMGHKNRRDKRKTTREVKYPEEDESFYQEDRYRRRQQRY